jgi:ribosome-associated toxin RatA of RatAB toxin-antitoxin module
MKNAYHGIYVALSIFLASFSAFASSDEIHVIPIPGTRELQGDLDHVLNGAFNDVWEMLIDVKSFPQTMPDNKMSKILEERTNFIRYHAIIHMPWPIADVEYDCDLNLDKERGVLTFALVKGTESGVKNFNGTWNLTKISDNKTHIHYTIMFEPDRYYPKWAMNLGMKSSLGNIVKKLQHHLDQLESARTIKTSTQK